MRPGQHGRGGNRVGTAEKVALAEFDPEITNDQQFGFGLDAFGHQHRGEGLRETGQALQRLNLDSLVLQPADEVLVDLDDLGTQLRPQSQAGSTIAKVVQRKAQAAAAQGRRHLDQFGQIGDVLVFGDLDHQRRGRDFRRVERLHDARHGHPIHHVDNGAGAEVQEQPRTLRLGRPRTKALPQTGLFQLDRQVLGACRLEQCVRRAQG